MDAPAALPLPNTYWVLPGRLLAGEHPAGPTEEATRERLGKLLAAGIRCFLDLTEPAEAVAYDGTLPLSIEYQRKPIPDHGLPQRQAHMREILDCLREALREGKPVYLHCRAGIGRTGTVVGCLLAEERGGEQALIALNRLWRQSARSGDWASIPETQAQTEYVRLWKPDTPMASDSEARPPQEPQQAAAEDPLLQPATLAAAQALRERFLGALLGLAVGDAIGAATQFRRPGSFAPVADLIGGGPFGLPPGAWSDDTAMALCLTESLLERNGFDPADQVARYRRWQREGYLSATGKCLGITAATARALATAQWRRQPFSGSHDPLRLDPEPLSRVAPVAMYFFATPEQAVHLAGEAARTTSQATLVLAACRDLARVLALALSGAPKSAILARASAALPRGAGPGVGQALAGAIEAFGATSSFREAVLHAANLGGDSDVTSTVCGQLSGAYYGASAIPAAWRASLLRRPLIEAYADRLLTHALTRLSE
jgi:ADP-ribosyl-[dinitrogen reductase] hydrolase